jgi:hypothetical protein
VPKPIKSAPKPRFADCWATGWRGLGLDKPPKPKRSPPNPELGCKGCETGWEVWGLPIYRPKMLNGSLFWVFWGGLFTTGEVDFC